MRPPFVPRLFRAPALLATLALALAACGGDSSNGSSTTIAGVKANDRGTKVVSGLTTTTVETDNYYFSPSVLTGKPGQKLTIELKNASGTEHNFTQGSTRKDVEGGQTVTVQVTFPASGVISFFCEYHRDMGMAGGLQAS